jgi:hypothetical protein
MRASLEKGTLTAGITSAGLQMSTLHARKEYMQSVVKAPFILTSALKEVNGEPQAPAALLPGKNPGNH